MKTVVLLLAAGSGKRFGSDIPKQYLAVAGKPLLLHTLQSLAVEPRIVAVQPVIAANDTYYADMVARQVFPFELLEPVIGGDERAISMTRGLEAVGNDYDFIAVHDAARALPSALLLQDVLDKAKQYGAAVPGMLVHDTIKQVDEHGLVVATLKRQSLRAVQTPQVARTQLLQQAVACQRARLHEHTDDASLLEAVGFSVFISRGETLNKKVTTQEDMQWLEKQLLARTIHKSP